MGYRLKPGRPIEDEVRRIADRQLELAVAGLRVVGDPNGDEAVHAARRHVKKVRALIRLVRPSLGNRYYIVNRRLRTVNRMLAPIADAEAVVETLARLATKYPHELSRRTHFEIGGRLTIREAIVDAGADIDHVLQKAAHRLNRERQKLRSWQLKDGGFRAIGPGLANSVHAGRHAMVRALDQPTIEHYHAWRRRVKDQWLHVRVLQERCGNALALDERRLETLDGCLGEYHNCALLQRVLTSDSAFSRLDAAHCLRVLRRYQGELRAQARTLGGAIHRETPEQFVKRVRRLWRSPQLASTATEMSEPWQRTA